MDDNLATTYPLSDSHNRGEDSSMPTNLRASRSRKDRPCDACRRLKHSCRIIVRGQPCVNCQRKGKSCTFEAPTRTALQKAEPDTKPHSTIQHDLDLNAWPISPKTSGSPRASATYTSISGGPSSTSPNGPLHSGQQRKLSKLLAAPDESDDSGSMVRSLPSNELPYLTGSHRVTRKTTATLHSIWTSMTSKNLTTWAPARSCTSLWTDHRRAIPEDRGSHRRRHLRMEASVTRIDKWQTRQIQSSSCGIHPKSTDYQMPHTPPNRLGRLFTRS